MAKLLEIDPDLIDLYLGAGEAAVAAEHGFSDDEQDAQRRLTVMRMKRDEAAQSRPRSIYVDAQSLAEEAAERRDASPYEAEVARIEDEIARLRRRRAEGAERRQIDIRLAESVREYLPVYDRQALRANPNHRRLADRPVVRSFR